MLPHTASEASTTPEKSLLEDRKRKRDVLSCLDCRRRKLKCDRVFPVCGRCQKGGNASSCTYKTLHGSENSHQEELDASLEDDRDGEKRQRVSYGADRTNGANYTAKEATKGVTAAPIPVILTQEDIMRRLESRLSNLERGMAQGTSMAALARDKFGEAAIGTLGPKQKELRMKEPEATFFKGRGFRTQFYGPSNPMSLLAHVCFVSGSLLLRIMADSHSF